MMIDQNQQIKTWSEQRDSLLNEIRILNSEKESIMNETKSLGLALSDLHKSINESKGRIEELVALENRYKESLSIDISGLIIQKSKLESDIELQTIVLKETLEKERNTIKLIESFTSFYNDIIEKISTLNKVAFESSEINQKNVLEINTLIDSLKKGVEEIIDLNQRNITETNIVINKVPAMLVELQKAKLIRHKI